MLGAQLTVETLRPFCLTLNAFFYQNEDCSFFPTQLVQWNDISRESPHAHARTGGIISAGNNYQCAHGHLHIVLPLVYAHYCFNTIKVASENTHWTEYLWCDIKPLAPNTWSSKVLDTKITEEQQQIFTCRVNIIILNFLAVCLSAFYRFKSSPPVSEVPRSIIPVMV